MDDLQNNLSAILNDPSAMQKIMAMAQSLGASAPREEGKKAAAPEGLPFDPAMLQRLSGMMGQGSVDPQQKALLQALSPYVNGRRIHKLENAMRAAKMAKIAALAMGQPTGR